MHPRRTAAPPEPRSSATTHFPSARHRVVGRPVRPLRRLRRLGFRNRAAKPDPRQQREEQERRRAHRQCQSLLLMGHAGVLVPMFTVSLAVTRRIRGVCHDHHCIQGLGKIRRLFFTTMGFCEPSMRFPEACVVTGAATGVHGTRFLMTNAPVGCVDWRCVRLPSESRHREGRGMVSGRTVRGNRIRSASPNSSPRSPDARRGGGPRARRAA